MSYVGGKSKGATHILEILNHPYFDGFDYLEPFVGMGHILRRVINKHITIASDYNPLLCELLNGIQQSKTIPIISRDQYQTLKHQVGSITFERAIACFCYSYNGKAWGGYCPVFNSATRHDDYVKQRTNYYKSLQINPVFMNTRIECISFKGLNPSKQLIYCDPPYRSTTGYRIEAYKTPKDTFDHDDFWNTMRKWSQHNYVFISEYSAPVDFIEIGHSIKNTSLSGKGSSSQRIEKLFAHTSIMDSEFWDPAHGDLNHSLESREHGCI